MENCKVLTVCYHDKIMADVIGVEMKVESKKAILTFERLYGDDTEISFPILLGYQIIEEITTMLIDGETMIGLNALFDSAIEVYVFNDDGIYSIDYVSLEYNIPARARSYTGNGVILDAEELRYIHHNSLEEPSKENIEKAIESMEKSRRLGRYNPNPNESK